MAVVREKFSSQADPQLLAEIRALAATQGRQFQSILEQALTERLDCEVIVTSKRLVPCETPSGSRLLAAARAVAPGAESYGSPTCSDWCFLRHLDAIKVGPGTSRRSHTADESVNISEVTAARAFYVRAAEAYLR